MLWSASLQAAVEIVVLRLQYAVQRGCDVTILYSVGRQAYI
jgi:hypothetical protein